ncbi:MAG: hypothetical protein ABSH06_17305 [Thermodesulfobacteriota bacterium]
MGIFKQNGNYLMNSLLKVLAIIALSLFILCSVSWLKQKPNRYQLLWPGQNGLRIDTYTGEIGLIKYAEIPSKD